MSFARRRAAPSGGAPVVVAWGELLWDLYADGARLGGCAANVAYHVAMLGDRALLVSRVGDDSLGRSALEALGRGGVDVSLVQVDRDAPTGSVNVELHDGEPRFRIASEAAWDRICASEAVCAAVATADVVCYGTLAQRTPLGSAALAGALERVPPTAIRLCDLNVRPPFATLAILEAALSTADVVKLNVAEARLVADAYGVDDPVPWLLEERGIRLVALTRGAQGSVLATRDATIAQAAHAVLTAEGDAIGAGDAFTAALAHHLAKHSPLDRAGDAASRYAAFVASQRGAMPRMPDELISASC